MDLGAQSVDEIQEYSEEDAAEKFAQLDCYHSAGDAIPSYTDEGKVVYVLARFNYTEGEFDPKDVKKFTVRAEHTLAWYVAAMKLEEQDEGEE